MKVFRAPLARFSRQSTCIGVLIASLTVASAGITASRDVTSATDEISARVRTNPTFPHILPRLTLPDLRPHTRSPRPEAISGTGSHHIPRKGIPATALAAYRNAERNRAAEQPNCHLSWELLAGIGMVESTHASPYGLRTDGSTGRPVLGPRLTGGKFAEIKDTDAGHWDGDREYDRAVGPLQFLPSTWGAFAADGNDDGAQDVNNIFDAADAAGRYLCANGGNLHIPTDLNRALLRYNHSQQYVRLVLDWTRAYENGFAPTPPKVTPDRPLARRISHQNPDPKPHTVKSPLSEVPAGNTPREKPRTAQRPDRGKEFRGVYNGARPGTQAGDLPRLPHQGRDKASEATASAMSVDAAQHCSSHPAPTPGLTASPQGQPTGNTRFLVSEHGAEHAGVTPAPGEGAVESPSLGDAPPEGTGSRTNGGCTADGEEVRAPESAVESPSEEDPSEALSLCAERQANDAHGQEPSRTAGSLVCGSSSSNQRHSANRGQPAGSAPHPRRLALP
ncbi:hypothetical protein ACR820_34535 [Streptomyces netropsis]